MAKLHPAAIWGLVKEARTMLEDDRPLFVSGALAETLVQELARGGSAGAVTSSGSVEGAAALVRVLAGKPTDDDIESLRAASRAKISVIAVQTGTERFDVPYVLATDIVACPPGEGFPVEEIACVLAARLGESATPLAARLPVLRDPVCDALIESFSRKNGVLGAAIFIPGADFPVLTLNQVRLVLRLASAHGIEIDQQRLPEVLGTVATGFGLRAVARQLLGAVPIAGWVLKGGVAYAGTRAVGEAARRYFAAAGD
ncbi:MAG: hypothetical protein ACR2GT_00510 [Gaiellaceae bacterium]